MPVMSSPSDPDQLPLLLDGFEGPLDLLLELARGQKVDLARISILSLVDQFLAVIEGARRIRLELAADWLVMAAWLAWLKSRLLLPAGAGPPEDAELAAETLAGRLRDLQATRQAALWLNARDQLGRDIFARGLPESFFEFDRSSLRADLPALMRGYLAAVRRIGATRRYVPRALTLWTVKEALSRLASLVGDLPDWSTLESFLPDAVNNPTVRRAAIASTLLAGLEMAREGSILMRQEHDFGPIRIKAGRIKADLAAKGDHERHH